jgi:transposase
LVHHCRRNYPARSSHAACTSSRLNAVYRSWAIACAGKQIYAPRCRAEWLGTFSQAGVRRRAEIYYKQLDALRSLRQQVRRELLAESGKHNASKLLCQIPAIGPIRAAQLIAILQTPYRFRTKRQVSLRGLNRNHNHEQKNIFKGAAIITATKPGPLQEFYAALVPRECGR